MPMRSSATAGRTKRTSLARLYSNENVAAGVVHRLRELGHDVLTSYEAGSANQAVPDDEVLTYAHAEGRWLLTNNRRDFRRLHREGKPHSGIVEFTVDADFVALATRIDAALKDQCREDRPYWSITGVGHVAR